MSRAPRHRPRPLRAPSHRLRPLIEDYKAVQVISNALERQFLQMNHVRATDAEMQAGFEAMAIADARGGNFQLLEELEQENALGAEGRALLAARRRGEFKARRGTYRRKRSQNHVIASLLPFIQQVVKQHYPTMRVTREDAIRWAAQVFDRDEKNFANFCRGRHRPRQRRRLRNEQ